MTLAMSPHVFSITSHFIEDRFGLHYRDADRELLAERVAPRALELGFDSLLDYYYFLRYDERGGQELQRLVETLVVHETYFFREPQPLLALVNSIVPEMLTGRETLRLWSAACATGEEPYTVAMMLAAAGLKSRVESLATDVSERALDRARAGTYGPRSLRRMPDDATLRRLLDETAASGRVPDRLRADIVWKQLNLVDAASVRAQDLFDIVLCRNVLIYFSDATVVKIANALSEALRPGGASLVGTAESLLRFGTTFVCEERGGAFFYRKSLK
jgi:chemotaxis protein methyltransferase CheR